MRSILEHLLIFFLLLLLPSQLTLHLWPSWSFVSGLPVDYLSLTLYLTDLLLLGLVAVSRFKFRVPLLVIVLIVLNISTSISPSVTIYRWLRVWGDHWLFKYLTHRGSSVIAPTLSGLSLSLIWVSLLTWAQFLRQSSLGGWLYWIGERPLSPVLAGVSKINLCAPGFDACNLILRPYSTFPHPNALAAFLLVSTLILLRLNSHKKLDIGRLALVLAGMTIPITFSRIIIFLAALPVSLWLNFKSRLNSFFRHSLVLLTFALCLLPLLYGNPSSLSERLALTQKSFLALHSSPFLGIGLGAFPAFQKSSPLLSPFPLNFQPVHNLPLLLATELGLPAALLVGYWLLRLLRGPLISSSWTLKIPILVVLITGMADHYWFTSHQNSLLLAILASVIYNFSSQPSSA